MAQEADLSRRPFSIKTSQSTYHARALIIVSGASARLLGLESEKKLPGKEVSTCATCDTYFFREKEVVVVGGGDSAMEEALFLTKFSTRVTIIHRRDRLRASKIMQEHTRKNEKIGFLWNTVVIDIFDPVKEVVEVVKLRNVTTGEETTLKTDGVFLALGHIPNTQIFAGQLEMQKGHIITHNGTKTSVPGVFAAGDVQDVIYRQAVTAAGNGCMAAIDAEKFLEAEGEN